MRNWLVLGQAGESTAGNRQACGRVGVLSPFSETSQGVPAELEEIRDLRLWEKSFSGAQ